MGRMEHDAERLTLDDSRLYLLAILRSARRQESILERIAASLEPPPAAKPRKAPTRKRTTKG